MEILKQGVIPKKHKLFKCAFCGCIFKAEEGEYTYNHDCRTTILCDCECPTCRRIVSIEAGGEQSCKNCLYYDKDVNQCTSLSGRFSGQYMEETEVCEIWEERP